MALDALDARDRGVDRPDHSGRLRTVEAAVDVPGDQSNEREHHGLRHGWVGADLLIDKANRRMTLT
jgi:hypothetical protein